ncbi:MAG: cysteine--tRNA ligase [archaeon]|nr:cysteine--tRNA ligase [archaeon]MCR4323925.1 cysteine--tRNA ligase [Nanoarchaeota archaeon]
MALKLYNTLTRKKETFKPIKKGKVGMYTCGPTVYWFAHVGAFRNFILADLIKRTLNYHKLKVNHIINITDVGHLTSDADEGEDKMENAAKKEGKTAKEVSEFYFKEFYKDFQKLNLIDPTTWPKATEHIKEQIDLIKKLEKKGYTYQTSDGIYFDTSKFKDYGKLSKKKVEGLEEGKRIAMKEKKHKTDFALWKFSDNNKRQQEWMSPWGKGFPGWHIECSAMSSKYLGEQIDIHTGGEDLIPIHHENEIAQSESASGKKPFSRFWVHSAFLTISGGKMSKSKGEIKTVTELEKEDGIPPLAYKYFTYSAHYRKPLSWNQDAIQSAVNGYKRLKEIIKTLKDDKKTNKAYLSKFEERINDDLDMPGAMAILWTMLRDQKAEGKIATIKEMDKILGLNLLKQKEHDIPKEIKALADERHNARKEKNWKKSDEIRINLEEKGWRIRDNEDDYSLEKV